jgi:hypothetical protein
LAALIHGCRKRARRYCVTWKTTLLKSVPQGVITWTVPVVAPAGTVVVISDANSTLNAAATPLKLTLVAPPPFGPKNLDLRSPAFQNLAK